jgi:hypothetical protein
VWFRRGRLVMVSPDSLGTACPLSGRNFTYRPVQISGPALLERRCLAVVAPVCRVLPVEGLAGVYCFEGSLTPRDQDAQADKR